MLSISDEKTNENIHSLRLRSRHHPRIRPHSVLEKVSVPKALFLSWTSEIVPRIITVGIWNNQNELANITFRIKHHIAKAEQMNFTIHSFWEISKYPEGA